LEVGKSRIRELAIAQVQVLELRQASDVGKSRIRELPVMAQVHVLELRQAWR